MNILITSASRKVGLVKTFKKALKENGGGKVFVGDINPQSPSLYFADEYIILPKSDKVSFIDELIEICKNHEINLLIPTRDEELSLFSKNIDKFSNVGIKVMVSPWESINICQNKDSFIEFCKSNGFDIPKTYGDTDDYSKLEYPLFIKPKIGKGGLDTFKVDSFDELKSILIVLEDVLVQEFVDWKEYTIDLFADFDGKVISAVPRERINVLGGESLVTKTFKDKILINESIKLAESLNLIGHNTIQCFFNGENVKFIEINPRFGGAAILSFAAGANSPENLIKLLNGENLEPNIYDFKDNYFALRFINEMFIEEKDLKK